MCGWVWVPGPVGVFMHVHACSPAYPTCNAYAKYPLFLSDLIKLEFLDRF